MNESALLVLELKPRWVPELKRQFINESVEIRGCRSRTDVLTRWDDAVCGLIVALDGAENECLQILAHCMRRRVDCPVVIIASERAADLEWPLRELGALIFHGKYVTGDEVARLCRRLLKPAGSLTHSRNA